MTSCGFCDLGLVPGKRDEWGFGIPCPYCDGTGEMAEPIRDCNNLHRHTANCYGIDEPDKEL